MRDTNSPVEAAKDPHAKSSEDKTEDEDTAGVVAESVPLQANNAGHENNNNDTIPHGAKKHDSPPETAAPDPLEEMGTEVNQEWPIAAGQSLNARTAEAPCHSHQAIGMSAHTGTQQLPPLVRNSPLRSIPGAYAVGGLNSMPYYNNRPGDANLDLNLPHHQTGITGPAPAHDSLTLATPVVDEDDLQHAQPMNNASDSPNSQQAESWSDSLAVFTACIIIVIVVGMVVWLQSGDQDSLMDTDADLKPIDDPSMAPSVVVSRSFLDELDLPDYTLDAIIEAKTPQQLAYEWLVNSNKNTDFPLWKLRQRFAVATVFYALGGTRWVSGQDWLGDNDECDWDQNGIESQGAFLMAGAYLYPCDEQGRFEHFSLQVRNAQGSIPREISLLASTLKTLDLTFNFDVTGSIPTQIGLMTRLQTLKLLFTSISGTVPSEIGLMSNLQVLNTGSTYLTGVVPTEIGNLAASLTKLYIGHTHLALPEQVLALSNLEFLYMGLDKAPEASFGLSQIFQSMPKLQQFFSFTVPFPGPFPTEIGLLSNLTRLGLGQANITGLLPEELLQHTSMTYLDLGYNALTGTIPTELFLMTGLTELYLNSNNFTGTIPTEVGLLSNMTYLRLEETLLSGLLPSEPLLLLPHLEWLFIWDTKLSGTIPDGLCNITVRDEAGCHRLDVDCAPQWANYWDPSACQNASLCGCGCQECPAS